MKNLRAIASLAAALTPASAAQQRILAPAGPAAQSLAHLGWFVLMLSLGVLVVMWFLIALVLTRPRGNLRDHAPADTGGGQKWIFWGGFVFPALVLAAMYVASLDSMSAFPLNKGMKTQAQIHVIGHQWWWEVHYLYGPVHDHFITADEIHLPVGTPVDIDLDSDDVIHSFWVPALHGKVDMIPGDHNRIRVEADRPGTFRGQCAEYCGAEHATMILTVVAQSPADFQAWLAHSRQPAAEPGTDEEVAGQKVFMAAACALCHTVGGTMAQGTVGPDLTHIGSRQKIASNWLDNDKANLAAWITHAQSLKPEVSMPNVTAFSGEQLNDLVVYLQSLK
jgi:cytochrome c oxidase subunit II